MLLPTRDFLSLIMSLPLVLLPVRKCPVIRGWIVFNVASSYNLYPFILPQISNACAQVLQLRSAINRSYLTPSLCLMPAHLLFPLTHSHRQKISAHFSLINLQLACQVHLDLRGFPTFSFGTFHPLYLLRLTRTRAVPPFCLTAYLTSWKDQLLNLLQQSRIETRNLPKPTSIESCRM